MATAADVRAWAKTEGRPVSARGFLPGALITDYDDAHPGDRYEAGPPRDSANGHAPDYPDDDFEKQFPEVAADDADVDRFAAEVDGTGETRPRKITPRKKTAGGGWNPFAKKKVGSKKKQPPRVSTEDLLGAVWRGGAKLLTPLPPLQRTLRMQAPVAGMLLDDVVRDTFVDPLLQPLARLAASGKTVQALVGPPAFVAAIMAHQVQRAGMDPPQEPHPLFMALAAEGLRSSLMAWMDVAGPKFDIALQREQEFEEKYGQKVDDMIAFIFAAPPAPGDVEAMMAEEDAIKRAQGIL